MAITFTHTFEVIYNGETIEGKVGLNEEGHSVYQIDSQLTPILAESVHDIVKSLHKVPGTLTKIEINVI